VGGDVATSERWRAEPLDVLERTVAGLGGERRDGQRVLSEAIADAMRGGHHLVAEAPTGSGKSLAYLAPAVASGLRVVVATSTIALQSQLVRKDLPALREHAGVPFDFALLKGRSNYLCRAKLRAAAAPDALFERAVGVNFPRELEALDRFADASTTGDRTELPVAVADASWAAVSCTSMECPGATQCNAGDTCFAEHARRRAQGVSVLVVNHALYCAHLAAGGNVLPEHDVVVLDEAHAFPENATNAFGADLLPDALTRLTGVLGKAGVGTAELDRLQKSAKALGAVIDGREGRIDLAKDTALQDALVAAAEQLATANNKLSRSDADNAKRAAQLAGGRLDVLRRLASPTDDDVVWIENVRNSRRLRIAPVAVGPTLAMKLLEHRPVVAVSATLGGEVPFVRFAYQSGFDPQAAPGRWGGLDDDGNRVAACGRGYASLAAPSSFDWRAQGMLYVGKDLPDPTRENDAWLERAQDRVCKLVNAAGGRALVLCTSHANVKRFADVLRDRTYHEVLAQGDADVARLTQSFLADETSVLVGTRSFWQGIDAPGVACVLVVIDRIPFPMPTDPLHAARRERAERNGANAFAAIDVPTAALVLAQGAGRLLRTKDDRGVVAVLDSRLATRDYRKQLLAAMPPLRRSIDLDEACTFLAEAAAAVPERADGDPEVRTFSIAENLAVRDGVACPVCGRPIGERCKDENDFTMVAPHEERFRAAEAAGIIDVWVPAAESASSDEAASCDESASSDGAEHDG
jgi:ATP-dependent DNA helicase DinG